MIKVWGRPDGSNVIKAMWCIGELGIPHQRIDWGGKFGGNDDPGYLGKNPNGRLPTVADRRGRGRLVRPGIRRGHPLPRRQA